MQTLGTIRRQSDMRVNNNILFLAADDLLAIVLALLHAHMKTTVTTQPQV
jgi:hypothetical protein